MSEYVKKDDLLLSFCEYCDSHVVGCGECPIKAAIDEIPVIDAVPVDFLKQFADGKRGYYSDFVIEAVKAYKEGANNGKTVVMP